MTSTLDEYRHLCNICEIVLDRLMDCKSFFRIWDALEIHFMKDGISEILWSVLAATSDARLASLSRKALEELGEYPAEPARRAIIDMDIFLFLQAVKANPWVSSRCQLYYRSLSDGREYPGRRYNAHDLDAASFSPKEPPCAR